MSQSENVKVIHPTPVATAETIQVETVTVAEASRPRKFVKSITRFVVPVVLGAGTFVALKALDGKSEEESVSPDEPENFDNEFTL